MPLNQTACGWLSHSGAPAPATNIHTRAGRRIACCARCSEDAWGHDMWQRGRVPVCPCMACYFARCARDGIRRVDHER